MTIWTKYSLMDSINQRVDSGKIRGETYIMEGEISDEALEQFQDNWDRLSANPSEQEKHFKRLYQSIIAGF